MKYREKLINLINKAKSDLDFAKKTYEDGDDDGLVGYLTYLVKELESINASINEQPSEEFKGEFDDYLVHGDIRNPNFDGPFGYDDIRKTAIHFANWQKNRDKQILSTLYDDCSLLKDSLDKVTTGNLSHHIGNIKFSITGMQVLIKQEIEE